MELILGGYDNDAALDTKVHTNSIDDSSSNGKRCRYVCHIDKILCRSEMNTHLKAFGYFALIMDTVAAVSRYR